MIYIHLPFCHSKCRYCAFFSQAGRTSADMHRMVDTLLREMRARAGECRQRVRTVYFGGGTPSMLPLDELQRVVEALHQCFYLDDVEEVTLECNPEDLTLDYLQQLRGLRFFNRLSLGIQSLNDESLRLLGRRHTAQQAIEAVELAQRVGFSNLSVDFMYGLPTPAEPVPLGFLQGINHVSAYALTVEERTALAVQVAQGRVQLPTDDEVATQFMQWHEALTRAGFLHYEVSNYARAGYESQHNSRYWTRTPYLGLGPGAHSFDGRRRRWNAANLQAYCSSVETPYEEEVLTPRDAYNELLMTSLRTSAGLVQSDIPAEYRAEVERAMQPFIATGWIEVGDHAYRPTAEGMLHADGMAAILFV